MKRPYPRLQVRSWGDGDQQISGYAIRGNCGHITGHLTPAEARAFADELHDAADKMEQVGHAR